AAPPHVVGRGCVGGARVGVGLGDRAADAARQPGAEGAPGRQDNTAVVRIRAAGKRRAVAVAVAGTTTSSVTDK
ncbi:hypothetical protein J4W23_26270, partial [Escherichia coli]